MKPAFNHDKLNSRIKEIQNATDEIEKIIATRYNNYQGRVFKVLKRLHKVQRDLIGDEAFLEVLRKLEVSNPKPTFKLPNES